MSPPPTPVDCQRHPVPAAMLLARAFEEGRRLVVWAPGRDDHAHHVAVEFIHPAVTGSVALPAVTGAPPVTDDEILLMIGDDEAVPAGGPAVELFIPARSEGEIMRSYHVLWELVQLELAGEATAGGDSTDFLYPFLDGRSEAAGSADDAVGAGSADDPLQASAEAKTADSNAVAAVALEANDEVLDTVAAALVGAVEGGRRVLTMGNGGSACDAARAVRLLNATGVPAQSLSGDFAVITALANDLGSDRIFARQLEAVARSDDVLIGFSTSGTSGNLLAAFDQAKRQGLTTVGFAGYGGAGFDAHPTVDHTLAVASQSVHRIQEAQAVLLDALVGKLTTEKLTAAVARS